MTEAIYHYYVFKMVTGSRVDVRQIMLALERSCEVHCATVADKSNAIFSISSSLGTFLRPK